MNWSFILVALSVICCSCASTSNCRLPASPQSTGASAVQVTTSDQVCVQRWSWKPDTPPRAVLVIAHGLRDHARRYDALANELRGQGFVVYAQDARGHGESGGPSQRFDSIEQLVGDLDLEIASAAAEYPGLPIFIYGHSLGGLVTTWYAIEHGERIRGIVTSGAALRLPDTVSAGEKAAARIFGVLTPGLAVQKVDDSQNVGTPEEKEAFASDPLIDHRNLPAASARAAVNAIEGVQDRMREVNVPLLALHGALDTATNPAGSQTLATVAKTNDKTFIAYPNTRHDLLHEPARAQVIADVERWLIAHLASAGNTAPKEP